MFETQMIQMCYVICVSNNCVDHIYTFVICKEIATGFIQHLAVEEITSSGTLVQIAKKYYSTTRSRKV